MRKLEFILCAIILLFLTIIIVKAKESTYILQDQIIVIDPGHGGLDVGTYYHEIYEKDINLKISLLLKKKLEEKGASVVMTRDGDYDLSYPNAKRRKKSDFDSRINLINNSNANFYLSIHMNYFNNAKYKGAQVFYLKEPSLAQIVQENLNKEFSNDRKATKIKENYYMYRQLNIDGILIECGFLSNSSDREKFQNDEFLDKFTDNIVDSIIKYKKQ